ncbi:Uncharacterised protein [Candidatus Ornithobacterium hominis]|uniref:hypothetical protein n=1 Tax=Candidatus Ornithobacterium hominis TaxID=2497989 RepID=UPI000E5A6C3B|nr:hypothetical protein [Candidatus Ornithobacterium hominis]SZD73364.1 Uncharacterised protein [Candidatus Ornithobacterium hominis]
MKKLLLSFVVLPGALATAQVGINTENPKATLEIKANTQDPVSGLLIPKVNTTERNAFVKPEQGLMIYNTDLKCHELNVGTPIAPAWECVATAKNVQTVSIEPVGFIGNFKLRDRNDPNTHKVVFRVTNNTSSQLTGIDLSFVKVDGVAQYVDYGQNDNISIPANSSVDLEYGISGTNWRDAVFTLTYDQYSSASFTLNIDKSIPEGDLSDRGRGDGGTADFGKMEQEYFLVKDDKLASSIDISKIISSNSPLIVEIPFTNGKGNYLAYTSEEVTLTDITGTERKIKLSYEEGNLDIGKGVIKAKITSVDGNDLKLPQVALGERKLIAQIPIKLNNTEKGTYDLYAFGGIPDKKFNESTKHKFVYMPIVSPTGRTWLNNNLGAEYNRTDSDVFNPNQQAKTLDDKYALGSRFQYHRDSDGHELTSIQNGEYKLNSEVIYDLAQNFSPNHSKLIHNQLSNEESVLKRKYNWVEEDYLNNNRAEWEKLWEVDGANNPCPQGYRPPKTNEIQKELEYLNRLNRKGIFDSKLKLVSATNNILIWSLEGNNRLMANPSNVYMSGLADQYRVHIRCIKHE